jgi:hypothetical protein
VVGQAVRLEDGRTGRLIEIVNEGEIHEALAVLSMEPGTADTDQAPIAAVTLPLPYSLPAA